MVGAGRADPADSDRLEWTRRDPEVVRRRTPGVKRNLQPLAVVVAVLALAAGCGSDDGSDAEPAGGSPAAGAAIPGGGLTVAEAIASTLDGPLLVKGYVVEVGDEMRLCTTGGAGGCSEPSLRVELEGDVIVVADDEQTSLLGEVADGVLTVDPTAIAAG